MESWSIPLYLTRDKTARKMNKQESSKQYAEARVSCKSVTDEKKETSSNEDLSEKRRTVVRIQSNCLSFLHERLQTIQHVSQHQRHRPAILRPALLYRPHLAFELLVSTATCSLAPPFCPSTHRSRFEMFAASESRSVALQSGSKAVRRWTREKRGGNIAEVLCRLKYYRRFGQWSDTESQVVVESKEVEIADRFLTFHRSSLLSESFSD